MFVRYAFGFLTAAAMGLTVFVVQGGPHRDGLLAFVTSSNSSAPSSCVQDGALCILTSDTCCDESLDSCGDGEVDDGEQCDDGGTDAGDGCSASCMWEACTGCVQAGGDEVQCSLIPQCTFNPGNAVLKFLTFGLAGNATCAPAPSCQTQPIGVCCPNIDDTSTVCSAMTETACTGDNNPFLRPTWKESPYTCSDCPAPPTGACCASDKTCTITRSLSCIGDWKGENVACGTDTCGPPDPPTGTCCFMKWDPVTGVYAQETEMVPSALLSTPASCESIRRGIFNPDPVSGPMECPGPIDLKITKTGPTNTTVKPFDEVTYTVTVTIISGEVPSDAVATILDSIPIGLTPIGLEKTEQTSGCSWPGGSSTFVTCKVPGAATTFDLTFGVLDEHCPTPSISPNNAIIYPPQGFYDSNQSNDIGFASPLTLVCSSGQGVCCDYTSGQVAANCSYPKTSSQCTGQNIVFKEGETQCNKTACPDQKVGTCCRRTSQGEVYSCTHKVTNQQCISTDDEWIEGDHTGNACAGETGICEGAVSLTTCCFAFVPKCSVNISVSSCEGMGGVPTNAQTCAQCPELGTCCKVSPSVSCASNSTKAACDTASGGWTKGGISCYSCQYDIGACCGAKGQTKDNVTKTACEAITDFAPATWLSGKSTSVCPAPAACCDAAAASGCSELSYEACKAKSGIGAYQGAGTKCTDPGLSCTKLGSCCTPGITCKQTTELKCPSPGVWSNGKTCDEACPTGACCYKNTSGNPECGNDMDQVTCEKSGEFQGKDVTCSTSPCDRFYCYQGAEADKPKQCYPQPWAPGVEPPVPGAVRHKTKTACSFACPQPDEKQYCCDAASKTCKESTGATCPGGGTPSDEATCKESPACKAPANVACCTADKSCNVRTGSTCPSGETPVTGSPVSCPATDPCGLPPKQYCCTKPDATMDVAAKCVEKTSSTVCNGAASTSDTCGKSCQKEPVRNWCCTNANTNTCGAKQPDVACGEKSAVGYYTQDFCIDQCKPETPVCAAAGESCSAGKPCCNTSQYQCIGGTCKAKTVACCSVDNACSIQTGTTCSAGTPLAGNPAACPAASTNPCGDPVPVACAPGCFNTMQADGTCPLFPPLISARPQSLWGRFVALLTGTSMQANVLQSNGCCCYPVDENIPGGWCCDASSRSCSYIAKGPCPGGATPSPSQTACQAQPACMKDKTCGMCSTAATSSYECTQVSGCEWKANSFPFNLFNSGSCGPVPACKKASSASSASKASTSSTASSVSSANSSKSSEAYIWYVIGLSVLDSPACSDGEDNDKDGRVDADDPGCYDTLMAQSTLSRFAAAIGLIVKPWGTYLPQRESELCDPGIFETEGKCVALPMCPDRMGNAQQDRVNALLKCGAGCEGNSRCTGICACNCTASPADAADAVEDVQVCFNTCLARTSHPICVPGGDGKTSQGLTPAECCRVQCVTARCGM